MMMVYLLGSRYPTDASLLQFFDAIEREIKPLPGVEQSVAWSTGLPLGASDRGASVFTIVGDPPVEASRRPSGVITGCQGVFHADGRPSLKVVPDERLVDDTADGCRGYRGRRTRGRR